MSDIFMNKFIKKKKGAKPKTGLLRRLSLWLLAIVGSLGFSLSPMSSVFAASIYDDVVHPVTNIGISQVDGMGGDDLTHNLLSFMDDYCSTAIYDDFVSTVAYPGGKWAITQIDNMGIASVAVYWSDSSIASASFVGVNMLTVPVDGFAILGYDFNDDRTCSGSIVNTNGILAIGCSPSPCTAPYAPFLSTYPITYPTGYDGEEVPAGLGDLDNDGLTLAQEMTQGTYDFFVDSDGDGVGSGLAGDSDYVESIWNLDRDYLFCDTSGSPPYTCAYPNPTKKDLYLEIDWMKNGAIEYKPTTTQINLVVSMFANHDITLHVDMGDFGEGEALSTYTKSLRRTSTSGQPDFWDYMFGGDGIAQNFETDRWSIWHYMISGYNFYEDTGVSGWSTVMGDALFVSTGLIEGMSGLASLDRAIANTIAHELGHNICLSRDKIFEEQPDECVYEGIDNKNSSSPYYNLEDYESVMNYRYQLTDNDDIGIVNYSDGSNGLDDHDDWIAVLMGLDLFSGSRTPVESILSFRAPSAAPKTATAYFEGPDGRIIVEGVSLQHYDK